MAAKNTKHARSFILNGCEGPLCLSSLRIAALFITAYCAFLRYDELAKLRCCVVNFNISDYVKITILTVYIMSVSRKCAAFR